MGHIGTIQPGAYPLTYGRRGVNQALAVISQPLKQRNTSTASLGGEQGPEAKQSHDIESADGGERRVSKVSQLCGIAIADSGFPTVGTSASS